MYPVSTHCSELTPTWKSRPICGSATFTTVESRKAIELAATVAARAMRPRAERRTISVPGWPVTALTTSTLRPRRAWRDCFEYWHFCHLLPSRLQPKMRHMIHPAMLQEVARFRQQELRRDDALHRPGRPLAGSPLPSEPIRPHRLLHLRNAV